MKYTCVFCGEPVDTTGRNFVLERQVVFGGFRGPFVSKEPGEVTIAKHAVCGLPAELPARGLRLVK